MTTEDIGTAIAIEKVGYQHAGTELEAHLAIPAGATPRPAVIICHAWRGQSDFEREKAAQLARELGVVGAALDLYGRGVLGKNAIENSKLMTPFVRDRGHLRARLLAGVEAVRAHPAVDGSRVAAIGFCFGGMCALDLARSGENLRGVVSLHGLFHPAEGVSLGPYRAKILVLHGHEDPMATPEQLLALQTELTQGGAVWESHVYGATKHAFTNPEANDEARGTVYSPRADRRSWIATRAFLEDVLA